MAVNAAAVEILIEKGRFEPEVALCIAKAIEASMMHAQLVTVPIFDARLQELSAQTRMSLMSLEAAIDRKFGQVECKFGELDAKIDLKFGELDAKIDRKWGELDGKIDRRCGELETKMEGIKAELIRWVFLAMLGNVALSAGATAVLNAFKHL
jgi:hypothetical protein